MDHFQKSDTFIFTTYARQPVCFVKGRGMELFDDTGKSYLDFLAGIAVCNLGHCHPAVTRAIREQAETLVHVSNLFYTACQADLAEALIRSSFADRAFFCNSGAEANEAAIKLARRYFQAQGDPGRYRIITMAQSFHGRTMATLSATGQDKIKDGFRPLLDGFVHVPFNDVEAVSRAMDDTVCAVMLEPVQGEGGVIPADPGYLASVRQLCDDRGILLIFDEIQTGMGRCGRLFAHDIYGVRPDIMTLAKALGNGLPIGAMLATGKAAQGFAPGSHASTFGGTPLVTRAALAVVEIINQPQFLDRVRTVGGYFMDRLGELKSRYPFIRDVRGKGLLIGLELDSGHSRPASFYVEGLLEKGFIINGIQDRILRFAPPLIAETGHVDRIVSALDQLFQR